MKHKKLERIDYVAPQVIDLGFSSVLYGQTCSPLGSAATVDGCLDGNTAAGDGCKVGSTADGSCHTNGSGARTMCEEFGTGAGTKCKTGDGHN